MSPRRIVTVSLVLAAVVGLNAFGVSRRIGSRLERGTLQSKWRQPIAGVQTLVLARFRPGEPEALALLATSGVSLVAGDGTVMARWSAPKTIVASATGDLDGDGADEVLIVQADTPPALEVLDGSLRTRSRIPLGDMKEPVRILPIDLDGDGRREVVVAGKSGAVCAFDRAGTRLWTYAWSSPIAGDREPRGLDDVKMGKERGVAVAYQGGKVALLDAGGMEIWNLNVGRLRRMRAFDLGADGTSEVLLGTDAGSYIAEDAKGNQVQRWGLGEAVTEIRPIELDGDPRQSEVFVGGKQGTFNFMAGGEERAERSLGSRITAARGIDTDGDGRDEVFVGTESGALYALRADGQTLAVASAGGKVEAIASVVSPLRDRLVVVGGGSGVYAFRLVRTAAPAWYNPWTAAVVGWFAIAGVAAALLRQREEPPPVTPQKRAEASGARARSLEAAAARVRAWAAAGKLRAEDATGRLDQIQKQIADSRKATRVPPPTSPPPPSRRG